ncbi:MAG TPA: molecular chaperone DnaJ [Schlesneria sp.]|jgi:molecular chaperone DnaJ
MDWFADAVSVRSKEWRGSGAVMATKRDYYIILMVEKTASDDEIKRSYRKLAAKHHPDRNPGDETAIEAFKEAAEAFDVLSNAEKRARYDRFGHAGVEGMGGGAGGGFGEASDIMDAFGEMFGDFFGGGGGRRSGGGSRARRGASLQTSLTIELLDAAVGCSRDMEIEKHVSCVTCVGTGAKPGTKPQQCDYCGGRGQVVQSQGFFRVQTTCPACRGQGQIVREKCTDCRGARVVARTSKITIKVPAGVDNGMQLCLRGEGEAGEHGGPAGDLLVEIHVKPHTLFERDGRHLTCQVPITFSQAALGTEMDIPILTGKHRLTVAAGTQPGEITRLRGQGMPDPHGGPRGDLHVQFHVEVPKKTTKKQEELLRQLAEIDEKHVSAHRKTFFESVKEFFGAAEETE